MGTSWRTKYLNTQHGLFTECLSKLSSSMDSHCKQLVNAEATSLETTGVNNYHLPIAKRDTNLIYMKWFTYACG